MNILIADDHTLFRDILNTYLDRMERGYQIDLAADLHEAFEVMEKKEKIYDLVILDLCMPGMNGFDGLEKFKIEWPDIPVAIISGVAQTWEVSKAIDIGAVGFFPKSMTGQALVHAIELVIAGEKFVPVKYSSPPLHNPAPPQSVLKQFSEQTKEEFDLTNRELDVLKHLAKGSSNKEIAGALDLQSVTIKLHVRSICRKLGAKNRTQAALFAQQHGLF